MVSEKRAAHVVDNESLDRALREAQQQNITFQSQTQSYSKANGVLPEENRDLKRHALGPEP